ncbi:hypothetical protein evm_004063 [Chilo suppressalis]|nr:hypothetical protein evm_004063 [Chilo suppressalis]
MLAFLVLIILVFTNEVIGDILVANGTYDDYYPVCPVSLIRRKRAHTEYTRWRENLETTPEFLVKVLDEDLATPNTRPVVAVNIQPITRGGEKIIVGGVIVPPLTSTQIIPEGYRDYTRFVPPTTIPVSKLGVDLYLAPQTPAIDDIPPIKPNMQIAAGRHSQRDESPPASPQFLSRPTSALYARQYAPIAQVAFTKRSSAFVEQKPTFPYTLQRTVEIATDVSPPTRTSELPEIIWPQRTRSIFDEFTDNQNLVYDDITDMIPTKTSSNIMFNPLRTSTIKMDIDEEPPTPSQRGQIYENGKYDEENKIFVENEKFNMNSKKFEDENREYIKEYKKGLVDQNSILYEEGNKKLHEKNDKDSDSMYSMMFYGDEENYSNKKDDYEDKLKTSVEFQFTTAKNLEEYDILAFRQNAPESVTDSESEDEFKNNITKKKPSKRVFGADAELMTVYPKEKNKNASKPVCSLTKLRHLNFNSPRTLAEITYQLNQWAEKSPLVKLEDITNGNLTTMDNPIYLMSVDDPSSGQIVSAKQTVMIVAGIQGRDHHAVAAAMYVLYQLIERTETHTDLLTKYRFWIIPVFNPDGYDYSMTFPHRREWTKNLRQNWEVCKNRESCSYCELYGLRCTVQPCYGVNLDRNFEYQWIPAEALRAEHPCGSLHAGARQLSEAETRALTLFLHSKRMLLVNFIAFKEGEVLGVMYPYSHTRKLRAFDQVYRQRASRAASAAYSISGRPYVAGQTSEFLPLYAGGIEDWVDGHLGIDNTYTIMMFRPTDSYNTKLITEGAYEQTAHLMVSDHRRPWTLATPGESQMRCRPLRKEYALFFEGSWVVLVRKHCWRQHIPQFCRTW